MRRRSRSGRGIIDRSMTGEDPIEQSPGKTIVPPPPPTARPTRPRRHPVHAATLIVVVVGLLVSTALAAATWKISDANENRRLATPRRGGCRHPGGAARHPDST